MHGGFRLPRFGQVLREGQPQEVGVQEEAEGAALDVELGARDLHVGQAHADDDEVVVLLELEARNDHAEKIME